MSDRPTPLIFLKYGPVIETEHAAAHAGSVLVPGSRGGNTNRHTVMHMPAKNSFSRPKVAPASWSSNEITKPIKE